MGKECAAVERAPVPDGPAGRVLASETRRATGGAGAKDGNVSTIISEAGRAELATTRCLRDRLLSHSEFSRTVGYPRPGTAAWGAGTRKRSSSI